MYKRLLFYAIMFGVVFLAFELFGYAVYRLVDIHDLFDHRESVLKRITPETFSSFVKASADPVLGWKATGPSTHQDTDCQGVARTYTADSTGARVYAGFDGEAVQVVAVGDSYTQSYESDDDDAYPAQLAKMLGVSVANHGVGGYGPVQSLLNLQRNASLYPQARVAILGIMYENLYRMLNSYRPVLYEKAVDYGLKPYMADGAVQPHPGAKAFASVDSFRGYAIHAFDNDFWAKPKATFPYSIALFRAVGTDYFLLRKFQKQFRKLGVPEYFVAFSQQRVTNQLLRLIDQFADYAVRSGLQPVLVFIPRNRFDTESATSFLAEHGAELNPALIIGDVGEADVDWSRFNLEEPDSDNICHPSPYGYRVIAEYVTELLRRNNVALRQG